jgi:hypothetical protein
MSAGIRIARYRRAMRCFNRAVRFDREASYPYHILLLAILPELGSELSISTPLPELTFTTAGPPSCRPRAHFPQHLVCALTLSTQRPSRCCPHSYTIPWSAAVYSFQRAKRTIYRSPARCSIKIHPFLRSRATRNSQPSHIHIQER